MPGKLLVLVGSAVLPGLVLCIQIILCRPSAPALDAEEHAADEGVKRGFSGFVLSVDNVDPVVEGDGPVMKFSEPVDM